MPESKKQIKDEKEQGTEDETVQNISVKGIRKDVYDKVSQIAKATGKTLGEVTNEAYKSMIGAFDGLGNISRNFKQGLVGGMAKYIENIKNVDISGKDLEEIGHKTVFKNIDTLTLTDVNDETFDKYVDAIINVKKVIIPATLRKSRVILKCSYVDAIELGK
ncbi:MAG: hypothetical protein QW597_05165 [Thermoplasmataceae archaeon]